MKLLLGLATFLALPTMALAAFSLESIQSIECTDPAPTGSLNVFFTTSDAAASTYSRRSDDIPYDYANKFGASNQTGTMTLNNDPDSEGGKIVLLDAYNPYNVGTLELVPTEHPHEYTGYLSGQVEVQTNDGTDNLSGYQLHCIVQENQ